MLSISAIVPNYNGKELLEKNLPSLFRELDRLGTNYEVIVVDDCSLDQSKEFILTHYPQISLISKSVNEGYSSACNAGIKAASNDLIFLMNNDLMLEENYFLPQFKYFESSSTFGVMGKIVGYYDNSIQDTAKYPSKKLMKIKAANNYLICNNSDDFWIPSFYLSGANALIDAKKLKYIGGFDEIYSPFYSEDLDVSIRAQRLGWKCYYENKSVCRHEVSATTNLLRKKIVSKIYRRNRFILHAIHYSNLDLFFFNIQVLVELLFLWMTFQFSTYNGFWLYVMSYKEIRKSKKRLQSLVIPGQKLLSINQIVKNMYSEISMSKICRLK
ncbi:MAG: glycosyltransferase family 2 protein [Marinilabiliaceae bacterium]|nr:glycosyltransferase family 2 protein [Marinilabiliaceae bacterium]